MKLSKRICWRKLRLLDAGSSLKFAELNIDGCNILPTTN